MAKQSESIQGIEETYHSHESKNSQLLEYHFRCVFFFFAEGKTNFNNVSLWSGEKQQYAMNELLHDGTM